MIYDNIWYMMVINWYDDGMWWQYHYDIKLYEGDDDGDDGDDEDDDDDNH